MIARFSIYILTSFLVATAAGAETQDQLMTRMDQAAATFTGMTANLKQLDHTDILGENDTQTATVKLKRKNGVLSARLDFAEPNPQVVVLQERTVQKFVPKAKTVEIYDIGKFGQQLDQFFLIGFGTSGKDLQKSYAVKVIGPETISGQQTTHIELIPKSKEALEYFKKAELWMAQGSPYPVQEKIHKNDKDFILITYSDVKLNVPLADKELELKLPSGVKKIYPNK
jgi:outer membrane lipoprotein-sorting protein